MTARPLPRSSASARAMATQGRQTIEAASSGRTRRVLSRDPDFGTRCSGATTSRLERMRVGQSRCAPTWRPPSTAWPPPLGARPACRWRSAPAFAPTPSRRFCGTQPRTPSGSPRRYEPPPLRHRARPRPAGGVRGARGQLPTIRLDQPRGGSLRTGAFASRTRTTCTGASSPPAPHPASVARIGLAATRANLTLVSTSGLNINLPVGTNDVHVPGTLRLVADGERMPAQ